MSTASSVQTSVLLTNSNRTGVCKVVMPNEGFLKAGGLLDQHSLVGQQLQLDPSPLWSAQICKLLQHVNV